MDVTEKIIQLLDEAKVPYKLYIHEPVRTSEEAAKVRGVDIKTGAKAMVIKAKDNYFLFVLSAIKRLDFKRLKEILQNNNIRFAKEEEAEQITNVKVGGIPPFGNILGLPTYFDRSITELEEVNFNIGKKTHSVTMSAKDLIQLVHPIITEFTQ